MLRSHIQDEVNDPLHIAEIHDIIEALIKGKFLKFWQGLPVHMQKNWAAQRGAWLSDNAYWLKDSAMRNIRETLGGVPLGDQDIIMP